MVRLPSQFCQKLTMDFSVRNPESITTLGLASFPFARRYLGNRFFFLFLRLLRCFSSAGIPPPYYFIHMAVTGYCPVVFPHSEICGSNGYLLLTAAYRSLSRPSSAPDAKAFALYSYQLDLIELSEFIMFSTNLLLLLVCTLTIKKTLIIHLFLIALVLDIFMIYRIQFSKFNGLIKKSWWR